MSILPFAIRFALCALTSVLFILPLPASAEADISRFGDEQETFKNWFAVNDTVMGGVSKGRVALNDAGHLVFTGDLSMKNNGGFASIRTRDVVDMLDGNNTINVRLRGDGRMYYLSLRDKNRAMAASHRRAIQTKNGQWIDVSVNLDEFQYTRFGRNIDRASLKPSEVVSMGFTLSDKKPGPFTLEIASITASTTKPTIDDKTIDRVRLPKSMQDTGKGPAMRLITHAISQGVPAYNQGHIEQCADLYENALKTLVKENRNAIGEYTARMIDVNLLLNAQTHSADDRAWSYRDMLDQTYKTLIE